MTRHRLSLMHLTLALLVVTLASLAMAPLAGASLVPTLLAALLTARWRIDVSAHRTPGRSKPHMSGVPP